MLNRLKILADRKVNFAFETTLAARSFAPFLRKCQSEDYKVNLIYIWLNSPDLAVSRVAARVSAGGHDIPRDTIIRRYYRSISNFFQLYSPLVDRWIVYDNSNQRQKIAEKPFNKSPIIYQPLIWQQFISSINP